MRSRSIGSTPPMTPRRSISSDDKSQSVSVVKKMRSESVDGIEKTIQGRVKKTRSELCTAIVKAGEFDSVELRKVNSLPSPKHEKSDEKTEHIVDDAPKDETVVDNPKIQEEVKDMVSDNSNVDEQIEDGEKEEEEERKEEEEKEVEMNVTNENYKNRVGGVEVNKISQFHNRTAPSPSQICRGRRQLYSATVYFPTNYALLNRIEFGSLLVHMARGK